MKLTKEQVEHIAHLARLDVTEEEKEKFSHQLSDILDYVEILNEIDTDDVEITTQITGLENQMREDKPWETQDPTTAELLACSPNPVEMDMIKVKKTID